MKRPVPLIALLLVAAGCGAKAPATLGEIERGVFARSCVFSACHKGASPAGGLGLDAPTYNKLVGKAATVSGRTLVIASDPDGSYLMEKLRSQRPAAGTRMPPTDALDADSIEMVRSWIADGAKNN
jgi:hypothetical protein